MYHITKQQRLQQAQLVEDAKSWAKKCGLNAKEVKDLNTFIKDKINETIKERDSNMHTMRNFEDLSISLRDK
eukprot:4046222-Ditylum_brightwellii.AAC.1